MTNDNKKQGKSKHSHNAKILKHLEKGMPITALQALNNYGCMRLAARINDLRNAGYHIETDKVNQNGTVFAKYRMVNL
jgi:hypothetical protein